MMLKKNSRKNNNERGMTLIELILSLTIFLIGIAAIYGVTRLAAIQKNTVNARTDQLRSARIALEYIRRDALNAGFGYHRTGGNLPDNAGNGLFGLVSDTDTERDILTSVIAGNNLNTNVLNFGGKTDVVAFISRDPSFNDGNLISYAKPVANGNIVEVTTPDTATCTNCCSKCGKYDLYLMESSSGTTQVVGMVTKKIDDRTFQLAQGVADDPFNLNQKATGNVDTQSLLITTTGGGTIKRVNMVSYSITNAGVLIRRKYGNQALKAATEQIETRELVYGVSEFQIKYYMEDGTTIDDPSLANNGRTNQMKMNNVVQIQVSITLASDPNDSQPKITTPIVIKEFISTKNLRYEAS